MMFKLNEARWCIYVSLEWVIISSGNGLSPVWYQAITWINGDLLSIRPMRTNSVKLWSKFKYFHWRKRIRKMLSTKFGHLVLGFNVLRVYTDYSNDYSSKHYSTTIINTSQFWSDQCNETYQALRPVLLRLVVASASVYCSHIIGV